MDANRLIGMWLRDAAIAAHAYGYVLRELCKDGVMQPKDYEPNYTYIRFRINVATIDGRVSGIINIG